MQTKPKPRKARAVCPRCGAEETAEQRLHQQGYVWYECGSYQPGDGVFHQGAQCKQKLLADSRPAEHTKQRQVLTITEKILQHAAELRELAAELKAMGCDCGGQIGNDPPHEHARSCPARMAWVARSMAGASTVEPEPPPKNVRHLAELFCPPSVGGKEGK